MQWWNAQITLHPWPRDYYLLRNCILVTVSHNIFEQFQIGQFCQLQNAYRGNLLINIFRRMEFSLKLHTIKSGLSIVYILRSHRLYIPNFLFLKLEFVQTNSTK